MYDKHYLNAPPGIAHSPYYPQKNVRYAFMGYGFEASMNTPMKVRIESTLRWQGLDGFYRDVMVSDQYEYVIKLSSNVSKEEQICEFLNQAHTMFDRHMYKTMQLGDFEQQEHSPYQMPERMRLENNI